VLSLDLCCRRSGRGEGAEPHEAEFLQAVEEVLQHCWAGVFDRKPEYLAILEADR
jgi:hypothetical protein